MDQSYLAARARAKDGGEEKEWGERDRSDLNPLVEKRHRRACTTPSPNVLLPSLHMPPPILLPNCLASKHRREVNQLPSQRLKCLVRWGHEEMHWPVIWLGRGINGFAGWKMTTIVRVGLRRQVRHGHMLDHGRRRMTLSMGPYF
jgi:hypothetical protein